MKKALLFLASIAVGSLLVNLDRATARDQFKKAFDKKYVKAEGGTPEETAFAEAAKVAKCNICHEGTNPKNRNAYGKAFNELITTKDVTNVEKMNQAMETVAKLKTNPDDPASPTYGERITKGQLPIDFVPPAPAESAAK